MERLPGADEADISTDSQTQELIVYEIAARHSPISFNNTKVANMALFGKSSQQG